MPIDRIKYVGFQFNEGEMTIFKAGELKYEFVETLNKWNLIDGTYVVDKRYRHIKFKILLQYLGQQNTTVAGLPTTLTEQFGDTLEALETTELSLSALLTFFGVPGEDIWFYPRLVDQFDAVDTTYYPVVCDQKSFSIMDAKKNGRFPMYLPITFQTITPVATYPTWINR